MTRNRSLFCHLKRPVHVKGALPGRYACHRTATTWTNNHDVSDADAVAAHGHPADVSPHPGNCRLGCAARDTVQDQYATRLARHRSAQTARLPIRARSAQHRPITGEVPQR